MTLRFLTAQVPVQSVGSLTIGVNTVERQMANFAPYPVYAEMTSDGAYARASQFDFDDLTNNTNPDIDRAMRHSMCYWDTGATGQFRNEKVPHPTLRDKSRMDGPWMAFVYDTPGTYTLRAHKYDPDGAHGASAGTTITVVDPTTFFSAAQTVLVDPTNVFAGAPHASDPNVNKFTSLDAARNFIASTLDRSGGFRLCLKKAETYADLTASFEQAWAESPSLIDSFGTGGNPLIDTVTLGDVFLSQDNSGLAEEWRVQNVDFSGDWNARASISKKSTPGITEAMFSPLYRAGSMGLRMETFCNVEFRDTRNAFTRVVQGSGAELDKPDTEKGYLFLQDVKFSGLGNYMCFGHNRATGTFMIGSEGVPDPDSCLGSMGRDGMPEYYPLNSHNAFRGGWGIMGWWSCGVEERHAWSGALSGDAYVATQQSIRHSGKQRVRMIFSGCYQCTAAATSVGFSGNSGYLVQVLVDKCLFLLSANRQSSANYFQDSFQPGVTVRNTLYVRSALPSVTPTNYPTRNFERFRSNKSWNDEGTEPFHALRVSKNALPSAIDANRNVADGAILNCQLVDLKSAADGARDGVAFVNGRVAPQFTVTEKNSIIHAPNLSTPINPGLALSATPLSFQSATGAPRWSWEMIADTTSGTLANTASISLDYPADWYGNPTTAADYAGAYVNPRHTIHFRDYRFVRYTGATAAFTVGATLSCNGAGGVLIEAVTDNGDGTGTIVFSAGDLKGANGGALTDTSGGSATGSQGTRPMRFTGYIGGSKPAAVIEGAIAVTFGASDITLQNTSGFDWPAGAYELVLDRGTTLMAVDEALRVSNTTLSQYKLATAIAPDTVPEGDVSLEDMGRNLRPGTNHPDAPSGIDSKGPWVVS